MKDQDLKIDLGAVQETLVIPLWARAKDAEKNNPIVNDIYARDIIRRIDYDFSKFETRYMEKASIAKRDFLSLKSSREDNHLA
ncbi:hypothetical protein KA005_75000, partial [bacterium]|nr:hypothetical protein [bacterium]